MAPSPDILLVVPKRPSKRGFPKRAGLLTRARSGAGKLGPLARFARDLADRMRSTVTGGRARLATVRGSVGGRRSRASSAGGALAGIADRVLRMRLPNAMEAIEIALLSRAMLDANGNITAAGRLLGIHRKAVERALAKHKLARRSRGRGRPRAVR